MEHPAPVLLARARLHARLDHSQAAAIVLAAPSGFGKTSLVRTWVDTVVPADVIWVSLESDLVSRTAFWQTVLAGTARVGAIAAPTAQRLLIELEQATEPAARLAGAIPQDRPLVLVIDAYERLKEMTTQVDADLLGLRRLLPQLTVVVTTRTSTGLANPARTLRGEVELISAEDLAFTRDETRALLDTFATPEIADSADRLHRATHGYPLALRAAMLALARAHTVPSHQDTAWQLLVAQDLRVQLDDEPTHDFVLATSVPPYFDADLAADLAPEHGDPAELKQLLDDLEWNGFGRWIPFAPGRQVFQYADSLRDAMLAEARQRPRADQVRAAELSALWLHRHGSHEAALEMAVGASLFSIAARVYATVVATHQDAIASSLVDRHLASVPSRALTQYPALAFGRGLACFRDPALRAAAADYFKISATWERPRFPNPTAGEWLLGHVAKVVSLRMLGRLDESARATDVALTFYASIPDEDRERLAHLRPLALRHLVGTQFQVARLDDARRTVTQALATATDPVSRNHTAVYAVGLGALEGRVQEARAAQALIDADAWRPGEESTHVNVLGKIGEATLRLDAFDFAGALTVYDDSGSVRDTTEFWPFLAWTQMHARLGLGEAAAEAHRIEDQLHRTGVHPGAGDTLGGAALRAALSVLWLSTGNLTRARPHLRPRSRYDGQLAPARMLARLIAGDTAKTLSALPALEAAPGHTVRSSAALLSLGAAAASRTGRDETATALLERAVALTGSDGARLHLMYLPTEDLGRLRQLAQAHGTRDVQLHLAAPVPTAFSGGSAGVALTPQERTVIAALVHHSTRADVAAALHVSENTVKTHLQRIYRKLGVNSRTAAIERTIELDLLDPR